MQDHELIGTQPQGFIRPPLAITKLDLKDASPRQNLDDRAYLSAPLRQAV